jgi:hypothetical protein
MNSAREMCAFGFMTVNTRPANAPKIGEKSARSVPPGYCLRMVASTDADTRCHLERFSLGGRGENAALLIPFIGYSDMYK